tara:strand:+ start:1624 stop:1851 length:228 start_codon:yes stop_codon:yes gene_type:complete
MPNNTRFITVVMVPGEGARTLEVATNAVVSDVVRELNAFDRAVIVDGEAVAQSSWNSTSLEGATEVFLTGAVKGN